MQGFLASDLQYSIDPSLLLGDLDFPPFDWQREALNPSYNRVLVVAARQSGKSSITAGDGYHSCKYYAESLNIIISPSEQQSKETMKKVDDLISKDPEADLEGNASFEKRFRNGARILALPGTERSVRGYSKPRRIILDEASRIEDPTYKSARPYLVGNPEAKLIAVTTPFGQQGWFYDAWENSENWHKILVKPAYKLADDNVTIVPDVPEDDFKKLWAKRNVSAYYSPRHTLEFLQEELDEIGWWWWRQEYGCEFLQSGHGVFDMNAVQDAYDDVEGWFGEEDLLSDEGVIEFA